MRAGANDGAAGEVQRLALGACAVLLRGFARPMAARLIARITDIAAASPFRHMTTPGGWTMSVALTNCGAVGWVTDRTGYRYDANDPLGGQPWPAMPRLFSKLAGDAAKAAGYSGLRPDACLINRYTPQARLSLHQDRDERDFTQPIVSVSLGLPAVFLWGGKKRNGRPLRLLMQSGDVIVWGGSDRLNFHGIHSVAEGEHPLTGGYRFNLTFRRAL